MKINNKIRARHAAKSLEHFADGWCDLEDALADILCDLMHHCDQEYQEGQLAFEGQLARARRNYEAEVLEESYDEDES